MGLEFTEKRDKAKGGDAGAFQPNGIDRYEKTSVNMLPSPSCVINQVALDANWLEKSFFSRHHMVRYDLEYHGTYQMVKFLRP